MISQLRIRFSSYFVFATVILFSQSGLPAASAPVTGSIHGILHAQDGTVIHGAKVTANKAIPANKVNSALFATGPTLTSSITAGDGSFALDTLPAGTYTLCAQAQAALHIDPCHWSETPPKVTLTAGQNVTGYNFSLVKGQALQVRLDDQGGLLASAAGAFGNPHVLMGVLTSKGQFYPVGLSSIDSGGRNHSLVVPVNTTLRLTVSSQTVKLTDSAGTALNPAGHVVPFRIDSGDTNPQPYLFHIVGKN
jgi:hypothetical protein